MVETLKFWTTGEDMTNLIRDFVSEGSFYQAYNILKDGGMDKRMIREFIEGKWKLEGDTRKERDLSVVKDRQSISDYHFFTAIKTNLAHSEYSISELKRLFNRLDNEDVEKFKNIRALLEMYSQEEILGKIWRYALEELNYEVFDRAPQHKSSDGVILRTGEWVESGFQGHWELYSYLYGLGLASDPDWTDDTWTIHVSSGQLSGALGHELPLSKKYGTGEGTVTMAQMKMLFLMRDHISGGYGFGDNDLLPMMRDSYVDFHENGSKYANLMFLKDFYPDVKLPAISREPILDRAQCIRTSPLHSIPGLLNSIFDVTENSINELELEWEKYKNVRERNTFGYFYQEYIEGKNGVSMYEGDTLEYEVSDNRGDIVQGVKGKVEISADSESRLRRLSADLHKYFKKPVQLEFVETEEGVLYVVQFRLIPNAPKRDFFAQSRKEEDVILTAHSFSAGYVTVCPEDILIVDSEADSTALLGKKALLVRECPKFSHILALSTALGIPSMYGVGDIEITEEVVINTQTKTAYVQKVDNK